jgi:hypothetical protein
MKMNKLLILIVVLSFGVSLAAKTTVEPIKKIKVGKNREFVINGKPFLPIMSWAQPRKNYAMLNEIGINTFCGNADPESAKEAGCYSITGFKAGQVDNGHVLAWIFSDEPDMAVGKGVNAKPRQSAEKVVAECNKIHSSTPKRLIFMTFTGDFRKKSSTYPPEAWEKIYPEFIKGADVLGFDIYPIYGSGDAGHLNMVGSGVADLTQLAGTRPVYTWIETSKGSQCMTYEKQPDVLPMHTRNEVWQAIINGATAIGYFTHVWKPEFKEYGPTPEMTKELTRLNAQLTRLAPAILSGPAKNKIEMALDEGLKCSFKATKYEGSTYIFAENNDLGPGAEKAKQFDPIFPRTGKAVFTISGLKAGTKIDVVDEQRTITAENGKFSDGFAPLAEHIYKLKL